MSELAKVYKKNPNIVTRKIAGEMVLVPIKQMANDMSSIYNLNQVGARIWEQFDGETSVEQIRDVIVAEYETTKEEAETDIIAFVNELEKQGFISVNTQAVTSGKK